MEFYSSVHHVYDQIFPLNKQQINFVLEEIQERSDILDIGCATGNLAIELAKKGFHLNAFDLDAEMISLAKQKLNAPAVNFSVGNMLNIELDYKPSQFDRVLCFGNTLVHLNSKELIDKFIENVFTVLKKGGKLMLQVLNYDYILNEKIKQLPIIENKKIKFIRKYEFQANGSLNFITQLTLKENGQLIDNQIELFPITKTNIIEILSKKGFSAIQVFGSFAKSPLSKTSFPLIVTAVK